MPTTDQADDCPLHGPRRPHVLVPAGSAGSKFEPGTVVVMAQVAGDPAARHLVRCMVLRGKDTRCHVHIVAGSGTKGVLGGRAWNARMWLGRPDHVARCLQLFDDTAWPRHAYRLHRPVEINSAGRARGRGGALVTELARFELYVCSAGAASWASARGSWDCIPRRTCWDCTVLYQSDATEEYSCASGSESEPECGTAHDFKQVLCEHVTKGVITDVVKR